MLASDMGLGKTKVFLSLPEVRVRHTCYKFGIEDNQEFRPTAPGDQARVATQRPAGAYEEEDKQATFLPTLIICPVNSIHQTIIEAVSNNPSYRILVYYGSPSQCAVPGTQTLKVSAFRQELRMLNHQDPKVSPVHPNATISKLCNYLLWVSTNASS